MKAVIRDNLPGCERVGKSGAGSEAWSFLLSAAIFYGTIVSLSDPEDTSSHIRDSVRNNVTKGRVQDLYTGLKLEVHSWSPLMDWVSIDWSNLIT